MHRSVESGARIHLQLEDWHRQFPRDLACNIPTSPQILPCCEVIRLKGCCTPSYLVSRVSFEVGQPRHWRLDLRDKLPCRRRPKRACDTTMPSLHRIDLGISRSDLSLSRLNVPILEWRRRNVSPCEDRWLGFDMPKPKSSDASRLPRERWTCICQ